MAQKPAFVLNVTVPGGAVDLNLAPDKREVLLPAEGAILGACYAILCCAVLHYAVWT